MSDLEAITSFTGANRFLSNFHEGHPIRWRGAEYPTAEHLYQAMKCADPNQAEQVRTAPTPGLAKETGRRVDLVSGWDQRRRMVMLQVVVEKFTQHPDLAGLLRATAESELVEGNTWGDTYWGQVDGIGSNYLGRILMFVRDVLLEEKGQ